MQPFASLRIKLITTSVSLTLIAIVGMTLYGYFLTRTALYGQALERSAYQVQLQADSITNSLQQTKGDALYLSVLRSLQVLMKLNREKAASNQIKVWQNEVAQDFLLFSSVRPMFRAIRYIDSVGKEVVAVEAKGLEVSGLLEQIDRSKTLYFRQTISLPPRGIYVSPFTQEPIESAQATPLIHYAIKLPDEGGIVVIDLHAGWLLRTLPTNPGQDTWALINQDGGYLVYPEQFVPTQSLVDVRPMLNGQPGNMETQESVFVFDTIRPSETTPEQFWVIYRQTPKSLLYTDITTFYNTTTVVIVGAALLTLALALIGSERILKPLLDLRRQVKAYGHGGPVPVLSQRLPPDEIGTLTQAFYEMAQELERKRLEEHRLIEKLITAQEAERKLVAYDLHDGLIQQLVGARYYLTNCCEQCQLMGKTECNGVKQSCDTLTEAIIEGRRIVEGLHPAVLDDLGLEVAIIEVAQTTAHVAACELKLDVQSLPTEPDKTVSVTVFRIAQEALNNIRKHANAKQITVAMHNGIGIALTITDDGKGFDIQSISGSSRGLGITTMKERAVLIHGRCEISSNPGEGTQIRVWVPLSPQATVSTNNGTFSRGEE